MHPIISRPARSCQVHVPIPSTGRRMPRRPSSVLVLPQGQIRFINDSDYVSAMLGAIAAEGYHAGAVRELLIQQAGAAVSPYGLSVNQVAQVSNKVEQGAHGMKHLTCAYGTQGVSRPLTGPPSA